MLSRLSLSSARLLIIVLAAALAPASALRLSNEILSCPCGYGEANCSFLSNGDLRCSVDKNGTRCQAAHNKIGLTFCTIRWAVLLNGDGGVSAVTFTAYRERLGFFDYKLRLTQDRLYYDCDDSGLDRSIVTTRCNNASCCERPEFTIPKLCLYRRILRPSPECYRCIGLFECTLKNTSCNIPSDILAACSKETNLYYSSGCSFTVLLWTTGEVMFYASNNAALTEEDGQYCVASSYFTGSMFTAVTCFCRGDGCNSGIIFQSNSTDYPLIHLLSMTTPRNNTG